MVKTLHSHFIWAWVWSLEGGIKIPACLTAKRKKKKIIQDTQFSKAISIQFNLIETTIYWVVSAVLDYGNTKVKVVSDLRELMFLEGRKAGKLLEYNVIRDITFSPTGNTYAWKGLGQLIYHPWNYFEAFKCTFMYIFWELIIVSISLVDFFFFFFGMPQLDLRPLSLRTIYIFWILPMAHMEKKMATYSSVLAWEIPQTEEGYIWAVVQGATKQMDMT